MATVGNLGELSFYCSDKSLLSFHDLKRKSQVSWSEHERNGEKSYLEYNHDGLEEVSLIIEADARYKVKPLDIQRTLHEYKEKGTPNILVIGGRQIGKNPFVILSIEDNYKKLHIDGRPIAISIAIFLKEYPNQVSKITTIPAAKQIGTNKVQTAVAVDYETYTVQDGDTLWKIAVNFYKNGKQYTRIYNANKDIIKNPDLIYTGWVLKIPK